MVASKMQHLRSAQEICKNGCIKDATLEKQRWERVTMMIPDRKMPVDERLMDNDCEYIPELRTEQFF